jgi:hypothetical protein
VLEDKERDYKDEYKKFQSSPKSKKYRAELNRYNRNKGTYGNGDGKDASHKGGKISGFEKESVNRGRKEKSRLKKEQKITEGFKKIAKKVVKYKDNRGTWNWEIESGIDTGGSFGNVPKIMIHYQLEEEDGFKKSGGDNFFLKEKDGTPYTPQKAKAFVNKIAKKNKIHNFLKSLKNISGSGSQRVMKGGKFVREGSSNKGEQKLREVIRKMIREDFAGSYPEHKRKSFDGKRRKQSEVLGYKLTGVNDVKTEIDDATVKEQKLIEAQNKIKDIRQILKTKKGKRIDSIFMDVKTAEDVMKHYKSLKGSKKVKFVKQKIQNMVKSVKKEGKLKEGNVGISTKKGKTIELTHKKSGKEIVVTNTRSTLKKYARMGYLISMPEGKLTERVIKVKKRPFPDVKNGMKQLKGEDKIAWLVWQGAKKEGKSAYEIKGKKLNVIGLNPRDRGFYVNHFGNRTGIRRDNLYYDGTHWKTGEKF